MGCWNCSHPNATLSQAQTNGYLRAPKSKIDLGEMHTVDPGIQVLSAPSSDARSILSENALSFVADLAREFEPKRQNLLQERSTVQMEIDAGKIPGFLSTTANIRSSEWVISPVSKPLQDRRVEITGPSSNTKMVINALNSGAPVYMTDFEDAQSPGWNQTIQGQVNVRNAANCSIRYAAPSGKEYTLNNETANLVVRPRGLHMLERHVLVDGNPIAASFFDFGLTFYHNAVSLIERGLGPYFYLPKLQGYHEARFWNDIFNFAQEKQGIPRGTIKATVLIEHILAAFQMDEILYELREHITALNLGRWDYIYSIIKTFSRYPNATFPDRAQVTMESSFLKSIAELLVQTCHKRGAHALGGMSTYIPVKDNPESNEKALNQVRSDKMVEASQGYDGAWVAHPGLVPVVFEVFESAFEGENQVSNIPETTVTANDLLSIPKGEVTEGGIRNNISVALQYLSAWIQGDGAVAISGLMEDTATAEISRSQIWQSIYHKVKLSDGDRANEDLYLRLRAEERTKLIETQEPHYGKYLDKAVELLDELVTNENFTEFLTVPGYRYLD